MRYELPQSIVNLFETIEDARNMRFYIRRLSEQDQQWFGTIKPITFYWLWYFNNKNSSFDWPICANCGKPIEESKITSKGIRKYCCRQCAGSDPKRREQYKQTCIEKYGVDHPFKVKEINQKKLDTFQRKYGGNAPICDPSIKAKMKETNQAKYGCDFPFESKNIQNKVKQTVLEKYGVDNPAKSDVIIEKRSKTARENNYEHYKQMVHHLHHVELLSTKQQFNNDVVLTFKCEKCGHQWTRERCVAQLAICPKCINNFSTSTGEFELLQFIKSVYDGEIVTHNRSILEGNQELDIYLPEKQLAFEYNGNWWHNELYCDSKYHINKTQQCRQKGIRLIHIFEYQWIYKRQQIKNIIRSSLGIFDKVVYARSCEVKNIDNQTYQMFVELNHLDRPINSSIRLGLFADNELVAIASFGKSRFEKNVVELYRFCTKAGIRVIGGLSKLIKHSGFDKIVSYVNLAQFTGEGYIKAGFKLVKQTAPNYQYTNGQKLIDRINCQKHKLPQLLHEKFDSDLTEGENMAQIGYYKLFDCGNLKFEWNRNEQ